MILLFKPELANAILFFYYQSAASIVIEACSLCCEGIENSKWYADFLDLSLSLTEIVVSLCGGNSSKSPTSMNVSHFV